MDEETPPTPISAAEINARFKALLPSLDSSATYSEAPDWAGVPFERLAALAQDTGVDLVSNAQERSRWANVAELLRTGARRIESVVGATASVVSTVWIPGAIGAPARSTPESEEATGLTLERHVAEKLGVARSVSVQRNDDEVSLRLTRLDDGDCGSLVVIAASGDEVLTARFVSSEVEAVAHLALTASDTLDALAIVVPEADD